MVAHVFFALVLSTVIVVMGAMYGEPDDGEVWRGMLLRWSVFVGSLVAVAVVMVLFQVLFLGD